MSHLKNFAPVPERAIGDRRLRERELHVLLAICRATNAKTGLATISQGRIAERCCCSRQKANASVKQLTRFGYIEKIGIRYSPSGGGGYLKYRVVFEPAEDDRRTQRDACYGSQRVISEGNAPADTPRDDLSVSSAEVTEFRAKTVSIETDRNSEASVPSSMAADSEGTQAWRNERDKILGWARQRQRGDRN